MNRALPILTVLALVGGCRKEARPLDYQVMAPPPERVERQASLMKVEGSARASAFAHDVPQRGSMPTQRMVTREADIRVVVSHPDSVSAALSAAAQAAGGFVEDAREWRASGQLLASLTLRVPDQQMQPTLDAIRHDAIRVENESITGQDVTEEYTDLNAQLTNLRATEAELRSLLVTVGQRTLKAADVLEVFNQLTDVRAQIEQTQARMGTLSKLAQLATIKVELVPDALSEPMATSGWRPRATIRGAFSDLLGTLRWVADALIWVLVYLVPIVLAVGIPLTGVALGVRAARRKMLGETPARIS